MNFGRSLLTFSVAALALSGAAFAQGTIPEPGPGDPRIRTVVYDPNDVVTLAGHLGYQMVIEFDYNERIENVAIGDSVSWQVTPNRRANVLFVKPVERHGATNMTVITNVRRYNFELVAFEPGGRGDQLLTYSLRFIYPEEAVIEVEPEQDAGDLDPATLNFDYSFRGDRTLIPARVFDDGRFTYFEFAPGVDAPAIFVIGLDGGEEMVNQQVRENYTVIDRVAREFVLRYGRSETRVNNDRMGEPPGFRWPWQRRRGGE